jgi:hypothetical protein
MAGIQSVHDAVNGGAIPENHQDSGAAAKLKKEALSIIQDIPHFQESEDLQGFVKYLLPRLLTPTDNSLLTKLAEDGQRRISKSVPGVSGLGDHNGSWENAAKIVDEALGKCFREVAVLDTERDLKETSTERWISVQGNDEIPMRLTQCSVSATHTQPGASGTTS